MGMLVTIYFVTLSDAKIQTKMQLPRKVAAFLLYDSLHNEKSPASPTYSPLYILKNKKKSTPRAPFKVFLLTVNKLTGAQLDKKGAPCVPLGTPEDFDAKRRWRVTKPNWRVTKSNWRVTIQSDVLQTRK